MYFMHIICESQSELTVKLTGPKLSTLGEHFTAEPYELSVYTYHAEGAPIEVTLFAAECVPRLYVQNIANLSKEHPVSQGRENYFVTLFHESTQTYNIAVVSFEDSTCTYELEVNKLELFYMEDSEPRCWELIKDRYYFFFEEMDADLIATVKVDGEGHYDVKITVDDDFEQQVEYAQRWSEIITGIPIESGVPHFLTFSGDIGSYFCLTVMSNPFEVTFLHKEMKHELQDFSANTVQHFAYEIPQENEPLTIIADIQVQSGELNVFSKLCNSQKFESCFFQEYSISNSVDLINDSFHYRVEKRVTKQAYVAHSIETEWCGTLCFLSLTIKSLNDSTNAEVMVLHEERVTDKVFADQNDLNLLVGRPLRYRYETTTPGLDRITLYLIDPTGANFEGEALSFLVDRLYPNMRGFDEVMTEYKDSSYAYTFTEGLRGIYFIEITITGPDDSITRPVQLHIEEHHQDITMHGLELQNHLYDQVSDFHKFYVNVNHLYFECDFHVRLTPIDDYFQLCWSDHIDANIGDM